MAAKRKKESRGPGPPKRNYYLPLQALSDSDDEAETAGASNTIKEVIPPIKVLGQNLEFVNSLLQNKGHTNYRLKKMSIGVKILCETTNLYNDVLKILKENECQFFSHDKNSDRVFKAVIFGLEYKTSKEVKVELVSRGLKCQDVKSVVKNYEGFTDTMYIALFDNGSVNLNALKRDHSCLFRTIIRWDYHRKPKNRIVQCRNCQMFGHGEKWCSVRTKCALCAGKHKTADCKSTGQNKCANCNGNHKSIDVNCPNRQTFLEIRENINIKNSSRAPHQQYRNNNNQTSVRSQQNLNQYSIGSINNNEPFYRQQPQQQQQHAVSNRSSTNNFTNSMFSNNVSYSSKLRGNNDLFTENEISQLTIEMITQLRECKSKEQQFNVIAQLTIKYLYSNIYV